MKNKSLNTMTAREYWKGKFGEYPQSDAEKLAVAMMQEYYIQQTSPPNMTTDEFIEKLHSIPNYTAENIRIKLINGEVTIGKISLTTTQF